MRQPSNESESSAWKASNEACRVKTNIDESDLGNVREGQPVTFHVDAYPNKTFTGTVTQVRLDPVVSQNVVTYAAIITARNTSLELKPGMTANVTIQVARKDDVLRVASAALRFRPTESMLAAFGQDATVLATTPAGGGSAGPRKGSTGTVWVFDGGLHAVTVATGLTDGVYTEVTADALREGLLLATRVASASSPVPPPAASSPLMPQQGPRRL